MGYFYPLPPTFIGGRQPYGPKLGQAQSGPVPDEPPRRSLATLGIVLAAWAPPPYALPSGAKIAPFLPAAAVADNPPPINRASLRIIDASHRQDASTVIYLCRIAPSLTDPAIPDNPPVRSHAALRSIIGQWQPAYQPLPFTIKVAPLLLPAVVPDNPPQFSYANHNAILARWIPPYIPLPKLQISETATEAPPDTTPDAFAFTDQSGVALSATITSASITVAGINAAAAISITGGTYSINGGAFTASAGTVANGDTVRARHTASASYLTATNTAVTIGGVSDTFTSVTLGDPAQAAYIYRPFSLNWWRN